MGNEHAFRAYWERLTGCRPDLPWHDGSQRVALTIDSLQALLVETHLEGRRCEGHIRDATPFPRKGG